MNNLSPTQAELELSNRLAQDKEILDMYITEVDKLSMEEKLSALGDETEDSRLTPWDIDGIVLDALGKLGGVIEIENSELAYDVLYEAITEAVHRD